MLRPAPPAVLAALTASVLALGIVVAPKTAFARVATQTPVAPSTPATPHAPVASATAGQDPAPADAPAVPAAVPPVSPAGDAAALAPAAETPGDRGEGRGGKKPDRDEKPRRGIPVTNELVKKACVGCHLIEGDGQMSRISYMRKTPEGWELSIKRMIRHGYVKLTPDEAKQMVRYLANDHGLARAEAQRASYEVERRVHWSEEKEDKDLRASCAECHTLGRVFSERRDEKEWKLLKATHLAFFPLARWQAFQGEQDFGNVDWESMSGAEAEAEWERRTAPPKSDQADKVLDKLAKDQGLFTPEWDAWHVNRRSVPLAGTWELRGHEPGRGDVRGRVTITSTGDDEYATEWEFSIGGAAALVRRGKGLLYSGYSWRGRSQTFAAGEPPELREALLLSEDWNTLAGRIFTGEYNEIGADVTLSRRSGAPAIFATVDNALRIPSKGAVLEVAGDAFPRDLVPGDFHVGQGVSVTKVERVGDQRVKLTVDVARAAQRGMRELSFRAVRGPADIVLYDTIDWVKVTPDQGLARTGGKMRPPQTERFEAIGMNRGLDDELYTADDYAVKVVPARWSLEEFPVREGDDDAGFVGRLDPVTGVFVPALDGPNPARKWKANNIGEVFVVATCALNVQDVPPKPKKNAKDKPAAAPPPIDEDAPVVMVDKTFRSRGHLLVMVPIYVQWDRYVWDQR